MKKYGMSLLIGFQIFAVGAMAQELQSPDEDASASEQETPASDRVSITGRAYGQDESDVDGGGSFSLYHVNAGLALPVRLDEVSVLRSSVSYDFSSYDFSDRSTPWEDVHTFALVSIYEWEGNGPWSYYAGGAGRVAAESDAGTGDAATGGGLAGFHYKYSETITFGAGLAAMSQIEDDTAVVPLITARLKLTDDWRLKLGMNDVATGGYGLAAIWDMSPEWAFSFGGSLHKSRFRIEGEGDSDDGVGQESGMHLYADATYHATPEFDVSGYAGIAGGGEIRIEDNDGHKIEAKDYDPALMVGVKASVKL